MVIQTDLIAGLQDTRFLGCTRRSVTGTGQPAAHPRACVQTRPPALGGPRDRKPGAQESKRWPPDVNNYPDPLKRRPSLDLASAGPAPHRPLTHSCRPPLRVREKALGRRGQSPGNAPRPSTPLRHCRPGSGQSGLRRGALGGPFPGVHAPGRPPAPRPAPHGLGSRPPSCRGRLARDTPTEQAGTAGAKGAQRAEWCPRSPPPAFRRG